MDTGRFIAVEGTVQEVSQCPDAENSFKITVLSENGTVHLIACPDTYVVDGISFRKGMALTGFIEADAPAPLIFPPQYNASVIAGQPSTGKMELSFFNQELVNPANTLKLNTDSDTVVTTKNGEIFHGPLGGHLLLVYYDSTTRSIPAQTVPKKIILLS